MRTPARCCRPTVAYEGCAGIQPKATSAHGVVAVHIHAFSDPLIDRRRIAVPRSLHERVGVLYISLLVGYHRVTVMTPSNIQCTIASHVFVAIIVAATGVIASWNPNEFLYEKDIENDADRAYAPRTRTFSPAFL